MPELRQNLATKEWVIIATERANRPEDFRTEKRARKGAGDHKAECPFCKGNEKMSETVTTLGDEKDWRVRVVKNKFPALIDKASQPEAKQEAYHVLPGEGVHEVIIDSPSHKKHPALLSSAEMEDVLRAYCDRFNVVSQNMKVSLTLLFKNHGESAGTSLDHPHSQLVGSSVVPTGIRHRMDEAEKHYKHHSTCVFCTMMEEERKQGVRILADTKHFCAFVLFAALSPFHIWILPKRHTPNFGEISEEEIVDFAVVLQDILKKIHKGLDNPDYNYVIQSAPMDRGTPECFHWYLGLVVRLSKTAGFELGSGMFINTSIPEESARFLNSIKV